MSEGFKHPVHELVQSTYSSYMFKDGTEVLDNGKMMILIPKINVIRSPDIMKQVRDKWHEEQTPGSADAKQENISL